jgi:hypothetical protein
MARKAYTVSEANALIPVLEAVLVRVRAKARRIEDSQEKLQLLDVLWGEQVEGTDNPDHAEFEGHRTAIRAAVHEIEETIRTQIAGKGIRFPTGGIEQGLLDFPTTWRGRWVYLCWRMGEQRITAWHEVDGGFAGRQPLTTDQARRMGLEDDPAHVDDSMLDF